MVKSYGGYGGVAYGRSRGWSVVRRPRRRRPPTRPPRTSAPRRMGFKVRSAMSFSKTQRRRRRYQSGKKAGDNQSLSYAVYGARWLSPLLRSLYKKITSRGVYRTSYTTNASSTSGNQGSQFFNYVIQSDLNGVKSQWAPPVVGSDMRIILGHVKATLCLRNQSNSNAKVTIYDCGYRNHLTIAGALDDPIELWDKGMLDYGAGSANQRLDVGCTPFMSPEFRRQCFVRKATVVTLEPGQQHDHRAIVRYNRLFSSTDWDNLASTSAVKSLTQFFLVVFHGCLGHESTTPGNVNFMPVTLDVAVMYEINHSTLQARVGSYTLVNNRPTVTNYDFMGENQDADLDPVAA